MSCFWTDEVGCVENCPSTVFVASHIGSVPAGTRPTFVVPYGDSLLTFDLYGDEYYGWSRVDPITGAWIVTPWNSQFAFDATGPMCVLDNAVLMFCNGAPISFFPDTNTLIAGTCTGLSADGIYNSNTGVFLVGGSAIWVVQEQGQNLYVGASAQAPLTGNIDFTVIPATPVAPYNIMGIVAGGLYVRDVNSNMARYDLSAGTWAQLPSLVGNGVAAYNISSSVFEYSGSAAVTVCTGNTADGVPVDYVTTFPELIVMTWNSSTSAWQRATSGTVHDRGAAGLWSAPMYTQVGDTLYTVATNDCIERVDL